MKRLYAWSHRLNEWATPHRILYISYLTPLLAFTFPLLVLAPYGLLSFVFDRGDAPVEVAEALVRLAILATALGGMSLWGSQHFTEEHLLQGTGKLLLVSALLLTLYAMTVPLPRPEEPPLLFSLIMVTPLMAGVAALAMGIYLGITALLLIPTASWLSNKTQYLSLKVEEALSRLVQRLRQ